MMVITVEEGAQPVTVQDVADGMVLVLTEVFRALALTDQMASDKLEDLAGRLLTDGQQIPAEPFRSLILAIAQGLIESETGFLNNLD